MKIDRVSVQIVEVPDEDQFAGPIAGQPQVRPVITVRLGTDQGQEGIGIAFVYGGLIRPLHGVASELAALTVGEDADRIEALHAKLIRHAATLATSGMFLSALSAIDCALWDLRGKAAGLPLWRLLGGSRSRVPTYASGPLHRGLTDDQVVATAVRMAEKGFKHVKLHVGLDGSPTPARELHRAKLVREALGWEVNLMCDVNERWPIGQAIDMGERLKEVGLFCIEDPSRHDDYAGLARISAALSTPVMAGENCWGVAPFRLMLEMRSVDIAMIDIMHVGGITAWMKIAGMAHAFNVPVVSHIMPEFQAQLVAAAPNGMLVEHNEWTYRLFDGCPELVDGHMVLSERPGHGLAFSAEFAKQV